MTDSSTNDRKRDDLPGFFLTLQPNETGDTGSHQAGEVHVRKALFGPAIPDNASGQAQTSDQPVVLYHATRGEYGVCDYTYFGGRAIPESRLRRFPGAWRADWQTGDLFVFIRMPGPELAYTFYHLHGGEHLPSGLRLVEIEIADGKTHGTFSLPVHTTED